ncbi:MAG TPA: class I SAM-dependent methyltransferase [Polyangiaceae bacterium]|nr:class I SAM-dependent methyltransferase [Polyangiaceae bacterium]
MVEAYEERRQREAKFHDEWASRIDPATTLVDETFTAPTAIENRYILDQFGDVRGKRILDYGSGMSEGGVFLAKQGASVVAVDVSAGMLESAERLARHHGVSIETRRVVGDGIPADASEFDLVYGNGVLHHVDLARTRPELARVMKRHATGCFIEPLTYNPVIDVYRRLADTTRTEDERPLSFQDVESFRENFGSVTHREFWLSTLSVFLKFFFVDRVHPRQERYWKKVYTDADRLEWFFEPLNRLDEKLLARLPALGYLCWTTVITVRAPRH